MNFDVVVIGGGPAGVVAAISAANEGASVALVEQGICLGGTMTVSQVCELDGGYSEHGRTILPAIGRDLVARLVALDAAKEYGYIPMSSNPAVGCDRIRFNPEVMKLVLDEMVTEAGVRVFFASSLQSIKSDDSGIELVIGNFFSRVTLDAKMLIDSSGNSEAIYRLDPSMTIKTPVENMQGVTMVFRLGGVDLDAYQDNLEPEELTRIIFKGMEEGALPLRILATCPLPGTQEISVSATRVQNVDRENVEDLSRAMMESRAQIKRAIPFIRNNMRGCQNAYLTSIAASLGIRERRKIKGVYEVTGEDIIQCRSFPDAVALGCYPVDIHRKAGEFAVQFTKIEGDGVYEIPFRTMITPGYGNIISAGKTICADDTAFAALRVMPCAMGIGNAAGLAAAMCARTNTDVREFDVSAVRSLVAARDFADSAQLFA